jgi:predicted small lipoprotein YifL
MSELRRLLPALAVLIAGCGQRGDLYLPEPAGEVVTRPTQTPVPEEPGQAPNSPQTVDSPSAPTTPAPEVIAPEVAEPEKKKEETKQPLPPTSPPTAPPPSKPQ